MAVRLSDSGDGFLKNIALHVVVVGRGPNAPGPQMTVA